MIIHLVSDLHLEFSSYEPHINSQRADVIVVPGDVASKGRGVDRLRRLWPDKPIIAVSGNHEHYVTEIHSNIDMMRQSARINDVHFLENETIVLDGVRFFGCTLWTDFMLFGSEKHQECLREAKARLNDFAYIRTNNDQSRFEPLESVEIHRKSLTYLNNTLGQKHEGPTVVVTHHAPSFKSVVPKYQASLLSACFASNLDALMDKEKVELWVHGHMHDSLDYEINGTRVICNPRGYYRYDTGPENPYFNPGLLIEIKKGEVKILDDVAIKELT